MHFVLGGSYNGKADWVRQTYPTAKGPQTEWVTVYGEELTIGQETCLLVLDNIAEIIQRSSSQDESNQVRQLWRDFLAYLKNWEESAANRTVVLIGTDISKGIVPVEASDRKWRDDVGWCYQDTVKECHRVDQIWYGVARRLK